MKSCGAIFTICAFSATLDLITAEEIPVEMTEMIVTV